MTSFQPAIEKLQIQISKQRLRIVPSATTGLLVKEDEDGVDHVPHADNPVEEREFELVVVNQSDRFASFEVELSTPGQPSVAANHWYDVEPKVCAKKPPGDSTTFRVVINRPPIPAINTTLDLMVQVFSVEYDDLDAERHLDLLIEQRSQPLQVHLVSPYLKVYPGERLTVDALAMNLQSEPAEITLKLLRLPENWFLPPDSEDPASEPRDTLYHTLTGGDTRRAAFRCLPPQQPPTASGDYDFDVEISDRFGNTHTTHGKVEVLPAGTVTFACDPRQQTIPGEAQDWGAGQRSAIFPLTFGNHSNLAQQVHVQAAEANGYRCAIQPVPPIDLEPEETQTLRLTVQRQRPLLGWERRLLVEVTPQISHPGEGLDTDSIHITPSTQALDLRVRPIIPLWLQLGGGLLALLLLAWWWWLRPTAHHAAPVTALQIVGQESKVLSGGRDQIVYRWDVEDRLGWLRHAPILRDRTPLATPEQLARAVRVIRESPEDADRVAIGLENGAISLWDINNGNRLARSDDRFDRVFALAFADGRQGLFSGHGSGIVRRWNLQTSLSTLNDAGSSGQESSGQESPGQKNIQLSLEESLVLQDRSISDLETISDGNRSVAAIGGQFNQLVLWDWVHKSAYTVDVEWDYPSAVVPAVGRYHSLTEVEVSGSDQWLLTADNRGFITVWDGQALMQCVRDAAQP
ncbi:MAG: hypothetical protein ACFB4J_19920, partial [Elainellaceae cyanobacterium]